MAKNNNNGNAKRPRKDDTNKKKRESMQRLRQCIKNDPALYEEAKRKERERYHARKKAGQIKSIKEMNNRDQRKKRKMWRTSSKKTYDQKKKNSELTKLLDENSPPPSPLENLPEVNNDRERMNRHRRRRNTRKLKTKIKELEESLKKAKQTAEKYKKRAHRLQKIKKDTPIKNVEELTKGLTVSPGIKKKLLFGEVLTKQIRENFKDKDKYRKVVTSVAGKVVKRYRFMTELSKTLSFKMVRHAMVPSTRNESLNKIKRSQVISNCVKTFLEKDEHSRMCPGAKDTITRKKDKRQKRYLNDTMLNLYKIFSTEHSHLKLSYASFCKLRPFWIVMPKVTDRDTCLCTVHENMNLLHVMITNLKEQLTFNQVLIHMDFSENYGCKYEAGHGKGAPDGIGGCIKRSADSLVAQGKDISNFDSFVLEVKEVCPGIQIIPIDEDSITLYEKIPTLDAFKGTLKVHHIIWSEPHEYLQARSLTCLKCRPDITCTHYDLGKIYLPSTESDNNKELQTVDSLDAQLEDSSDAWDLPKSGTTQRKRIKYKDVYSDSEDDADFNVGRNDYVLVKLSGKKSVKHYVAVVTAKLSDELEVKFMKNNGFNIFVFPPVEDCSFINIEDVVGVLGQPRVDNRERYSFENIGKYSSIKIY
ncbi:uncharacterized protein LOC128984273 [Macrosteles quadrilineatus]|uniref:uncharacterized protein LOC128984273 n=1 Tax=Macrosteles quadrilineatus TaxID=74068 RepID=UPI0023E1CB66|nr:uncharacterized protein LOC128984273 [Macrosteles quadrilineatus]